MSTTVSTFWLQRSLKAIAKTHSHSSLGYIIVSKFNIMSGEENDHKDYNSTMSTMMIFDSLPYVETVHNYYEQYALALIEDEMKQKSPVSEPSSKQPYHRHPLLQDLPLRNVHLEKEYNERLQSSSNPIQMSAPSDSLPIIPPDENNTGTTSNVGEWQDAVRKAKLAYEKERLRSFYLDLQDNSEKLYNETILEPQQVAYKRCLESQTQTIHQINIQRKSQQTEVAQRLSLLSSQPPGGLQTQYQELLEKQRALKFAIHQLEQEVEQHQDSPPATTLEPNTG
jgi:hypothetical protein